MENKYGLNLLLETADKCAGQMEYFLQGGDLWQKSEIQGLYDATRTLSATLEMIRNYEDDIAYWDGHRYNSEYYAQPQTDEVK